MSMIRKGLPGRFPKGLKVVPIKDGKFRVALSADFAQIECDFTAEEVEKMQSHLGDVLQMVKLTTFNHAPTKQNIDVDDEESRA